MKTTTRSRQFARGPASESNPQPAVAPPPPQSSPQTPPPAPEKTPTRQQCFRDELAAIYAGRITPEAEIYSPLVEADILKDQLVGVLSSQRAKEFFSLGTRLRNEALLRPAPRVPGDVEKWSHERAEIEALSELAAKLFWMELRAEFPEAEKKGDVLGVTSDWRVTVSSHSSREDSSGLPLGLLASLLRHGFPGVE